MCFSHFLKLNEKYFMVLGASVRKIFSTVAGSFLLFTSLWYRAGGGPSARSGHRMTALGNQLLVFGGFHDNGIHFRYHNDLYLFSLDDRKWTKLTVVGMFFFPTLILVLCRFVFGWVIHSILYSCAVICFRLYFFCISLTGIQSK